MGALIKGALEIRLKPGMYYVSTGYSFWYRWCIFYTNLHELFCQFIRWTNWVNYGKIIDNCWISCQVMADTKKI